MQSADPDAACVCQHYAQLCPPKNTQSDIILSSLQNMNFLSFPFPFFFYILNQIAPEACFVPFPRIPSIVIL